MHSPSHAVGRRSTGDAAVAVKRTKPGLAKDGEEEIETAIGGDEDDEGDEEDKGEDEAVERVVVARLTWKGAQFPLFDGENIIGREEVCEVRLDHSSIASKHAEIIISHGQATARDLRSINGTFVETAANSGKFNRLRVGNNSRKITQGCRLRFGMVSCVYTYLHPSTLQAPTLETIASPNRNNSDRTLFQGETPILPTEALHKATEKAADYTDIADDVTEGSDGEPPLLREYNLASNRVVIAVQSTALKTPSNSFELPTQIDQDFEDSDGSSTLSQDLMNPFDDNHGAITTPVPQVLVAKALPSPLLVPTPSPIIPPLEVATATPSATKPSHQRRPIAYDDSEDRFDGKRGGCDSNGRERRREAQLERLVNPSVETTPLVGQVLLTPSTMDTSVDLLRPPSQTYSLSQPSPDQLVAPAGPSESPIVAAAHEAAPPSISAQLPQRPVHCESSGKPPLPKPMSSKSNRGDEIPRSVPTAKKRAARSARLSMEDSDEEIEPPTMRSEVKASEVDKSATEHLSDDGKEVAEGHLPATRRRKGEDGEQSSRHESQTQHIAASSSDDIPSSEDGIPTPAQEVSAIALSTSVVAHENGESQVGVAGANSSFSPSDFSLRLSHRRLADQRRDEIRESEVLVDSDEERLQLTATQASVKQEWEGEVGKEWSTRSVARQGSSPPPEQAGKRSSLRSAADRPRNDSPASNPIADTLTVELPPGSSLSSLADPVRVKGGEDGLASRPNPKQATNSQDDLVDTPVSSAPVSQATTATVAQGPMASTSDAKNVQHPAGAKEVTRPKKALRRDNRATKPAESVVPNASNREIAKMRVQTRNRNRILPDEMDSSADETVTSAAVDSTAMAITSNTHVTRKRERCKETGPSATEESEGLTTASSTVHQLDPSTGRKAKRANTARAVEEDRDDDKNKTGILGESLQAPSVSSTGPDGQPTTALSDRAGSSRSQVVRRKRQLPADVEVTASLGGKRPSESSLAPSEEVSLSSTQAPLLPPDASEICLLFTKVEESAHSKSLKKLAAHGVSVTADPSVASHCITTAQMKRTPKLMVAMNCGVRFVVTESWLQDSAKKGHAIDLLPQARQIDARILEACESHPHAAPQSQIFDAVRTEMVTALSNCEYLVRDLDKERLWNFSMPQSLAHNRIAHLLRTRNGQIAGWRGVFAGFGVYVTPGVCGETAPETAEMIQIVESGGGVWVRNLREHAHHFIPGMQAKYRSTLPRGAGEKMGGRGRADDSQEVMGLADKPFRTILVISHASVAKKEVTDEVVKLATASGAMGIYTTEVLFQAALSQQLDLHKHFLEPFQFT